MENTTFDSLFGCAICRKRSLEFRDYFERFHSPRIADRMAAIIQASRNIREGKDKIREVLNLPIVEPCPS